MAALVQAFPSQQSTNTLPLLQPRPQSASAALQPSTTAQSHPHTMHRSIGSYGPSSTNNNTPTNGYRSFSSTAPVAPYAFTSTPSLSNNNINNNNKLTQQQWSDNKTSLGRSDESKPRPIAPDSLSSSSTSSMSSEPSTRYQNLQPSVPRQRPDPPAARQSSLNTRPLTVTSSQNPPPIPLSSPTTTRPTPDRYRRGNKTTENNGPSVPVSPVTSAMPSVSGTVATGALYNQSTASTHGNLGSTTGVPTMADFIGNYPGQLRSHSVDDIHTHRLPYDNIIQQQAHSRRRSVGAFTAETLNSLAGSVDETELRNVRLATLSPHLIGHPSQVRPETNGMTNQIAHTTAGFVDLQPPSMAAYSRRGSTDSSTSAQSSTSVRPSSSPHEINLAHVPARDSSSAIKRTTAPSPLSKPATVAPESEFVETRPPTRNNADGTSNAAERLAALAADPRKGLKNRLRRAFSFGSAAELRKAAAGNSTDVAERARLRQEKFREEQEAKHSRNAERQGATEFGEGIYNGQGGIFAGSTDNVSVSSTASSASIMIRKMGKGMRRSTRSLVGLFRPKSVVGVPPPDSSMAKQPAIQAQVTPLTVEAERGEGVVNVDSRKQAGGGTAYPKLEKNPIDGVNSNSFAEMSSREIDPVIGEIDEPVSRKNIIGGEKDRAEVLRRGILKRSGSESPVIKPADFSESAQQGRGKSGSLSIEGGDVYVISSQKFRGRATTSDSMLSSPNGSKYSVSFSPRITFHDTWPSGEYDRRGDIATCNRLTPMLAQQIKEELNTFKMEMDVHEESKIYTHFF